MIHGNGDASFMTGYIVLGMLFVAICAWLALFRRDRREDDEEGDE